MTTVFVLWMLANIVPGFALYDGTAGPTAYTHSGWWMVIQFFVLLLGEGVTRFSLHYSRSEGVVEKGIVDGINRMYWYLILVGLALVSHLIHLILMGLEVQMCDSTLCKDISWVFWATFALIAVHPFLLGWLMYRVMVFRANLEAAIGYDKLPTTVLGVPPSAPPQFQKESAQIGGRVKKSLKMLHHIK